MDHKLRCLAHHWKTENLRHCQLAEMWLDVSIYWSTKGKECGSDRSSRPWGGAPHDNPKNGWVRDYCCSDSKLHLNVKHYYLAPPIAPVGAKIWILFSSSKTIVYEWAQRVPYLPVYKLTFHDLKIVPKICPRLIHGSKIESQAPVKQVLHN